MNRLARLLGLLYPRAWRDRYGVEFQALLDDMQPPAAADLLDIAQGALRMHFLTSKTSLATLGGFALAGAALGFAVTFALTPHFRSQAAIRISGVDAANRGGIINGIAQKVFRRSAMAELLKQQGLYKPPSVPLEDAIEEVRRDITVTPDPAAVDWFVIAYVSKNQAVSKSVVDELVGRFMEENLRAGGGATLDMTGPVQALPFRPHQASMPAAGFVAGLLAGIGALSVLRRQRTGS